MAPRMVTSDFYQYILDNYQFFPENVNLDSIYFYHPESLYTFGDTTTALWLKPFMITEVLKRPINDQIELQRPQNYVDIFMYGKKTDNDKKSSSNSKK